MDLTTLPVEVLAEIIAETGPESIGDSPAFLRVYQEYKPYIRSRWLVSGHNIIPESIDELKFLEGTGPTPFHTRSHRKYTIPYYPVGANLLASNQEDIIRYALEHNLLTIGQSTLIHLIGRPALMSLVPPMTLSVPIATTLYSEYAELPTAQLQQQVYSVSPSSDSAHRAINQLIELIRTREDGERLATFMNNMDSSISWLMVGLTICTRLSNRDIIWLISTLNRVSPPNRCRLITHLLPLRLIDAIESDLRQDPVDSNENTNDSTMGPWNLTDVEWHAIARNDLEIARMSSTDTNLGPLAASLYHSVEHPASTDLSTIDPHYHRLYVEQWPNVEFTGVDDHWVANDYTRVWGKRYDFNYVMNHYSSRQPICPRTPLTAVNVIKSIKLKANFDWFGMIRSAIDELIDHSPDGSYTSWFDRTYPKVGDGGKELGMHMEGSRLVPDCEIKNGVPDTLPLTKILLFIVEHTSVYIYFKMEYLNLPRNIFRIIRPRLVYRGQPFNDDTLARLVSDQAPGHVFIDDLPGRWPSWTNSSQGRSVCQRSTRRRSVCQRSTSRRSTMVCRHWIHTTNLTGLRFPIADDSSKTQSLEDFVNSCV